MKKQHIELTKKDKGYLDNLLSKGIQKVRKQKRALGLKKLDAGMSYKSVSDLLEVSYPTVLSWAKKYRENGLSFLEDKPRCGRPLEISGIDRAKITALACSEPPAGYARWSLRLLADKLVELELLETRQEISHTEVGRTLKKMNFNLTEKEHGVFEL